MIATFRSILPLTSVLVLSRYTLTLLAPLIMPVLSSLTFSSSKFSFAIFNKECAKTVDVVVPSPASLTVFLAACFISVAPMFSTGCNKTTLSATVTPSFVITGLPSASS